jgi:hypothetical protein
MAPVEVGDLQVQPGHVPLEGAVSATTRPQTEAIADLFEAGRYVDGVDELAVRPAR